MSEVKNQLECSAVDHPSHYNQYSGVEAVDIAEQMPFNLGNVIKYIFRCEHKGKKIEDLKKASWYLNREIARLTKNSTNEKTSSNTSAAKSSKSKPSR
jgi:hypothetical protein